MSIVPASIIKTYAEALGITNLSEEVLTALCQDVEYRTRELIQDATKFMQHAKRTKLAVSDVNHALQARNAERLYGYDPTETMSFKPVPNSSIFYVPREEVDLEAFIQQPLPKAPQPPTLTSHWLAIDGLQPMIPENPNLQDPSLERDASAAAAAGVPRREHVLDDAEIKPLVKHILSKELQAYYDTVIADVMSGDPDRIKAALFSVATDSGLQQLLPYFIQFVAEMIPKNLRHLPQLQIFIGLLGSLLANEHLFVEPYLHQIMPPVLTCLLGKRLCEDPEKEDHWSLRDRCAGMTADLCRKFGNIYATLVPRVTKTMAKTFMDASKPLPSHYGAIVGLAALGAHAIESLILPHLETYLAALQSPEAAGGVGEGEDQATPAEISRCRMALKNAASKWVAEAYVEGVEAHEAKYEAIRRVFTI